jgi:hypothetical protein
MVAAVGDTVADRVGTPSASALRTRARHLRTVIDLALIAVLGAALLRLFLWPTLRHAYPFPVGPDVPVYLWWTRVATADGLALAGERPGAPALIATVTGALDQGLVAGLGGIQYALGPAIGLAAAALARGRGRTLPRGGWLGAGVLAGAWATYLGGGYVSNLVFAAAFIAAAAALARRTRRGTIAAALVLGGGAITHPGFFVVGAIVLAAAGAWAALHEGRFGWHTDAGRVTAALLGGVGIAILGLAAATVGGPRLGGETSTDAFLRTTGQLRTLRRSYLDRFRVNWRRYSPFMTVALATAGGFRAHGFARRFLLSWAAVSAGGLAIGAATGWFPPDRILMFAFCLPMLAAFGLVALGERTGRWWLAWPIGIVLTALMVAPAVRDWRDQFPYTSPDEIAHLTLAGRIASDRSAPGTPLVFVADSSDTNEALFLLTHTANVARAALPPERAGDVYVFLGTPADLAAGHPSTNGDPGYDLASAASFDRIPDGRHLTFVVGEDVRDPAELDTPGLTRWDPWLAASEGSPEPLPAADGELSPVEPRKILEATWRTFLLLIVLGLGWSWWALGDVASGVAGSAAFGAPMLALTAFALERLGAPLGTIGTSTLACALAGGCGYALLAARLLRQRRRRLLDPDLVLEQGPVLDP